MVKIEEYDSVELIVQIKQSNHDAFAKFFRKNYPMVISYIYQYIKDKETSQDLAQDVFVNLWNYRAKLSPSRPPHGILKTISKRLALNELRKISHNINARDIYWNKMQTLHNPVEDQLLYDELFELTHQAVASLPLRQQEVFRLSREQGLSHEEIANTLRISKSTVNNLLVQAIKTVKKALIESELPFVLLFLFLNWILVNNKGIL